MVRMGAQHQSRRSVGRRLRGRQWTSGVESVRAQQPSGLPSHRHRPRTGRERAALGMGGVESERGTVGPVYSGVSSELRGHGKKHAMTAPVGKMLRAWLRRAVVMEVWVTWASLRVLCSVGVHTRPSGMRKHGKVVCALVCPFRVLFAHVAAHVSCAGLQLSCGFGCVRLAF